MISGDATATFGWAWLAATVALALHVLDEATHDFLSWYNPRALRVRRILGGLPFPPTFTFLPWVLALTVGILVLGTLTPSAYAGEAWMRPLAYGLAAIHIANGCLHLIGSLVAGRALPGVWSAPLLLTAGAWLGYAAAGLP